MTEDEDGADTASKRQKSDGLRVHIRITEDRLRRWRIGAAREESDLSRWVRLAVDDYLKRYAERASGRTSKKKPRRPKRR